MNLAEILTSFLAFMGSVAALVASVWFIVQILDTIANHRNRKDQNRMWRKDIHIQYLTSYNSIVDAIENKKNIDQDDLTKLLALTYSAGRNNYSKIKSTLISKKILIKQIRDIDSIDTDFMINKNLSFKQIVKSKKKWNLNNLTNIETKKILIAITTYLFTEHIDLIKYDEKFEPAIKFFKDFDLKPKKELMMIFKKTK